VDIAAEGVEGWIEWKTEEVGKDGSIRAFDSEVGEAFESDIGAHSAIIAQGESGYTRRIALKLVHMGQCLVYPRQMPETC